MTEKQRYFIELSFDGTNYHGWQIQKNATSVQEVLNEKLSVILREPMETTGCGRTDTGVHARQFFAHFDAGGESIVHSQWSMEEISSREAMVSSKIAPSTDYRPLTIDYKIASAMDYELWTMDYLRRLNSILPKDIAVKRILPVAANAHARFDARLRTYEYHIHFNKDPFKTGYSWELRDEPDLSLMNKAAAIMMEHTDFSCFSKSNTQVKTNICKITEAEWLVNGDGIKFTISADRFLRNMVRAIVGTLLMVGRKEIGPESVREIIESKNRSNAGMSVPACGLYLTEVKY